MVTQGIRHEIFPKKISGGGLCGILVDFKEALVRPVVTHSLCLNRRMHSTKEEVTQVERGYTSSTMTAMRKVIGSTLLSLVNKIYSESRPTQYKFWYLETY